MSDIKINKEFWLDLDKKLSEALVPRFSSNTARPCVEEDFEDYSKTLADKLKSIILLLDIVIKNEDQWSTKTKKNLMKVLVIMGEQHCKYPWNTNNIVEISEHITPMICKIFGSDNVTQILSDEDIFLSIIMFLRPKLLKDTWKSFPAAVACYKWLLEGVQKPLLKRHLPEVLPTALIIFDDYVEENQVIGLRCIHLIIEHCQNYRSLKNLNYDEVIFQALEKMSHKATFKLIVPLYLCTVDLLENIQYCDSSSNSFGWTKFDIVLSSLLDNMEWQSDLKCRHAYVTSLTRLLNHSSCGKWTERLTRILSEYCEDDRNLETTNASLNLLKTFLSIYQPCHLQFYTSMYSSLLKLRHKLSSSDKNTKETIKNVDTCISSLNNLYPKLSEELLKNKIVQSIINVNT